MFYANTVVELRQLIKDNPYVIVDYFTNSCVPCKIMAPIIDKVSQDPRFSQVQFAKFNAENPDDTADWSIRAVPTIICFKNGIEVNRQLGVCNEKVLAGMIETMLMSQS